jgi:type III secretion protein C
VISEKISGNVTGRFNMRADAYVDSLASVFGLISFYDGAVAYVYASGEAASRVVSLRGLAPERLRQALNGVGALDRRYPLRINEAEQIAHVSGPPRFVDMVEELAAMLQDGERKKRAVDDHVAQYRPLLSEFRTFELRYAWAQDTTMTVGGREVVIPGVATTLRRLAGNYATQASRDAGGAVAIRQSKSPNTSQKLRGGGLQSQDGSSLRRPGGASEAGQAYVEAADGDGSASSSIGMVNVSLPRIEADARTNTVVVHDLPDRLARYGDLIAKLDTRPVLVQIEAAIIDVSNDSIEKLGINWADSQANIVLGRGNGPGPADTSFRQSAVNISNSLANAAVDGVTSLSGMTTIVGNMGRLFLAKVNLLAQDGKAYVHARPSILAINNTEAILENTQTFYVRLAGEREVDLFNVSAGTMLRVTAGTVEEDGVQRVKLAIRIEDGAITGQVVDQIPVVQRSTVGTHAMISEGQSLLIGGYSYNVDRDLTSKVPLLGDIPMLGALFTFRNKSVMRAERMFLITPRIIAL